VGKATLGAVIERIAVLVDGGHGRRTAPVAYKRVAVPSVGWMFRPAFAAQQLEVWSVHELNQRPAAGGGAPVTACQKPHEHGPMRRPQSRGDSRESHRTPRLGSRSFRLERPARRHLDVLTPDHVETSVASAVMGRAWGRRRSAP